MIGPVQAWDRLDEAGRLARVSRAQWKGMSLLDHPAWRAIVLRAFELGWPKSYLADLWVHDADTLAITPHDRPFMWAIGESGTTLLWFDSAKSSRREWHHDAARSMVRTLSGYRPEIHWWDGRRLVHVSHDSAVELLCGQKDTL